MRRPMPGPPEHRLTARPHGDDGWCPICHHLTARRPYDPSKHLTNAECAAEFWRAEADEQINAATNPDDEHAADAYRHIRATWHRFATRPHAFKEAPNQGAFSFKESE